MNGTVNDPHDDHSSIADHVEEVLPISLNDSTPSSSTVPVTHSVALFILKAKEERRIPQWALDGLLDDFHETSQIQLNALGENIKKCLKELNCTSHIIAAVDEVISSNACVLFFLGVFRSFFRHVLCIFTWCGENNTFASRVHALGICPITVSLFTKLRA